MRVLGLFLATWVLVLGVLLLGGEGRGKDIEVRVLLSRTQGEVVCSSPQGLEVRLGKRVFVVSSRRSISFLLAPSGVLWKEKNIAAPVVTVRPKGEVVYFGKRPYRGHLEICKGKENLEVINVLSLEDYLKGTAKLEANPSWPEEALKAWIVVARTYALKNLGRHRGEGFDFCSTVHCQRYGGVFAEDSRTNSLVEETRGIILTYQGKPASVVFHSESGGYTDSAKNVWGKDVPYLVEVPSPWEDGAPHASWRVTLSSREIAEALRKRGYIESEVFALRCEKSEKSGRVTRVFVSTDLGTVVLTGNEFREAIGFDRLPSTFFDIEGGSQESIPKKEEENGVIDYREWMERDWNLDDIITFLKLREKEREAKNVRQRTSRVLPERPAPESSRVFVFVGRGWGHGVGLSQWGAVGMARNGATFSEILEHYFPGCELGRVVVR